MLCMGAWGVWRLTLQGRYRGTMATNEQARTMSAVVGERVRLFREAQGIRQEDIANEARRYGFPWGRSSVAALEAGNRDLSIGELLILPSMIKRLGGWDEPLIPGETRIKVNENLWIQASQIPSHALLLLTPSVVPQQAPLEEDRDDDEDLGVLENDPAPTSLRRRQEVARQVELYDYILLKLWPDQRSFLAKRSFTHGMEIAKKVADRVKTPTGAPARWQLIQAFSWGLWGRSIGDERDARANARGNYETKRALQSARGHVTRELIDELQAEITARWGVIESAKARVQECIMSEEGMDAWDDELMKLRHPDWHSTNTQEAPGTKRFLRRRK